jgi:sigma-B regulation protein RsbU (phosphoserine phosphatase)
VHLICEEARDPEVGQAVLKRAPLRWRWCVVWAAVLVCLGSTYGIAQVVDATHWNSGLMDLNAGWLEHEGDDPAWAKPDLDDSGWRTVELDDLGRSKPGWRWYRLHLKLSPGHAHAHLLVVGGAGVYEVYVGGKKAGDPRLGPWYTLRRPVEQVVPLDDNASEYVVALRTHAVSTYTMWNLPLFLTVAVGSPGAIDDERAAMESQRLYAAIPSVAINLVLILAGLAAFGLFWSQREHKEYLWLGVYLFLLGISNGLLYCGETGLAPIAWNTLLGDPLIYFFMIAQIEFTFSFSGRRVGRMWRAYEVALLATLVLIPPEFTGALSNAIYVGVEALIILPAALLLPVLLLVWYRQGNREAGWLILPSLLPAAAEVVSDIGTASIDVSWGKADFLANPIPIGPVSLQVNDIGDFLFVLAIGVVMFFRFTRVSREQSRVAAELEAAREIQQRLVPAKLPQIEAYQIETAYFPAQEVGGDFYQVFEQGDGAQLIVVGDVSGKGLKAAMTGTLAIGALRTLAAEGLGPGAVLTRLNRQLAETGDGGFITCVCLRAAQNGEVTIANAGHLAPYCNGKEMQIEADLPLGIFAEQQYTESTIRLEPGDRLTLLSDGVLEARDAQGGLFGFERTTAISTQRAAEIAAEAQRFGQEDDITVLTLAWDGLGGTSAARARATAVLD